MMRPRPRPWIAAARLGLGLANVRSCSTVGAGRENSEKNIYLVFSELSIPFLSEERRRKLEDLSMSIHPVVSHRSTMELSTLQATHVVRRIALNSHSDDGDEVELQGGGAYTKSESCEGYVTNCTSFRSKIIIPLFSQIRFRDIGWIDTSKQPISFQVSSRTDPNIRSFSTPKYNLQLGEIDGKLYSIDYGRTFVGYSKVPHNDVRFNHFEVFDPEGPLGWRVLDFPVRFQNDLVHQKHTLFLPEIKKILISKTGGTYCFDATKPNDGWKYLNLAPQPPNCLGRFQTDSQPLFVHNYLPEVGDFYAVFDLQSPGDPNHPSFIRVLFMSDKFQFSEPVNRLIQLPESSLHYLVDNSVELADLYESDKKIVNGEAQTFTHKFIHLGDKKVGLFVKKNVQGISNDVMQDIKEGSLLLITFGYEIIVTTTAESKPKLEIETKWLETGRFHYETSNNCTAEGLMGAFLL